ncbi:hypothetical protein ETU09_00095 [Apibacter muscae]|uniref:Uncharacterized protein n=1 Tax=Apibacter muscae TaxID=2509004 RepID=A0A563DMM7_9FLAO|nr:hypothetical protein [Apibacter muscae]TWP31163.1 hypothetical protein ETU09_00095 [Apibacter muscae]
MIKINNLNSELQGNSEFYSNLADKESVKKSIGDIIAIMDSIIREAIKDVNMRKQTDPNKYRVSSQFYSQDLNATIKKKIVDKMHDFEFMNHVKYKINRGSYFFIIKHKYVLYIKVLRTKQNKPSFNPKTFNNLADGGLFPELKQIPLLFMGPNINSVDEKEVDVFVTSMISKNEVNWSAPSLELFKEKEGIVPINSPIVIEENEITPYEEDVAKIKEDIKIKKKNNNS